MTANGFPPTPEQLAGILLNSSPQKPWANTDARNCFIREVTRSHKQLQIQAALKNKAWFCDELARLINIGVLPNIADSKHLAFDAGVKLLSAVGLKPPNPSPTLSELETQFGDVAKPRAPTTPLANFWAKNWN